MAKEGFSGGGRRQVDGAFCAGNGGDGEGSNCSGAAAWRRGGDILVGEGRLQPRIVHDGPQPLGSAHSDLLSSSPSQYRPRRRAFFVRDGPHFSSVLLSTDPCLRLHCSPSRTRTLAAGRQSGSFTCCSLCLMELEWRKKGKNSLLSRKMNCALFSSSCESLTLKCHQALLIGSRIWI